MSTFVTMWIGKKVMVTGGMELQRFVLFLQSAKCCCGRAAKSELNIFDLQYALRKLLKSAK